MLTLVLLSLSDPARSTRFSLEIVYSALECVRERDWEEREREVNECDNWERGSQVTLTSTWMVKMQ